jgi:hypothetical protein
MMDRYRAEKGVEPFSAMIQVTEPVMTRGRRTSITRLIESLDGSPEAKQRLTLILETVAGLRTLVEAGQQLDLSERHLRTLRGQLLQQAVAWLQPRSPGRPVEFDESEVTDPAQAEIQRLRVELQAAQVREEIALALPHLFRRRQSAKKARTRRHRPKQT